MKRQAEKTSQKPELKRHAYLVSIEIIKFTSVLPSSQKVYPVISNQLLRAATSIGANTIEAQAASSKREFIKFYHIALKSANETKYWLGLLRDATNTDKNKVCLLLQEAQELSNILGASLLTMKNKRKL